MQRWLRCVLAVVLAATVARTWLGPEPLISTAQAQIPDSGMQRKQLLDETRRTNQLLTELVALLKSGTVKVRVVDADNNSAPQRDQRRR